MPLPMPKPPLMDIQRLQCENPPKPHPRGRSIASRTAKPGARHVTHAPTYATPPEPLPFPDCKNHLTHPRMPRHTQAAKSSDASQPPTLFQQATHARTYVSRQNRPRTRPHTPFHPPTHATTYATPPEPHRIRSQRRQPTPHACPGIRNLTHQVRSATPASSSTRLRIPSHTQPVKPRNVPARNRVPSRANPTLIHPTHRIFTVDMGVITIQKINRPASPCCC